MSEEPVMPVFCTIIGKVVFKDTKNPATGLEVKAYEKYEGQSAYLSFDTVKKDGSYQINYTQDKIGNPDKDNVTLYLEVLSNGNKRDEKTIEKAGIQNEVDFEVPPISTGPQIPPETKQFTIFGRINLNGEGSFEGLKVTAFGENNQEIGRSDVNSTGDYSIKLSAAKLFGADKKSADLIIRINDPNGLMQAETRLTLNEPRDQECNFEIETVWLPVTPMKKEFIIFGDIERYDGGSITGLIIRAFAAANVGEGYIGLGREDILGSAFVKSDGTFLIKYTIPENLIAEYLKQGLITPGDSPNLLIKIYSPLDQFIAQTPMTNIHVDSDIKASITLVSPPDIVGCEIMSV